MFGAEEPLLSSQPTAINRRFQGGVGAPLAKHEFGCVGISIVALQNAYTKLNVYISRDMHRNMYKMQNMFVNHHKFGK